VAASSCGLRLKQTISEVLKSNGFTNKASTWWRKNNEVCFVVNLQKSNFGDQYYVNIGISVIDLALSDFPPAHKCQITTRLSEIVGETGSEDLKSILNCESPRDMDDRLIALRNLIAVDLFEFLDDFSNLAKIKNTLRCGKYHSILVHWDLKDYLGV
jgi:hypothetical protein